MAQARAPRIVSDQRNHTEAAAHGNCVFIRDRAVRYRWCKILGRCGSYVNDEGTRKGEGADGAKQKTRAIRVVTARNRYQERIQRPDLAEDENGQTMVHDYSSRCIENMKALEIEALVVIDGDGTLTIADKFSKLGVQTVGVPKTIDDDLRAAEITFGFHTVLQVATDGDRP
jgi:Phosphofructokinase